MNAIRGACGGRGFLGAHAGDLVVGEAVELQVGQTPVGVAEIGPGRNCRMIGLDRLGHLTYRFQRMCNPQPEFRIVWPVRDHGAVQRDRRVVVPETDKGGCGQGAVIRIVGIHLQQKPGLLQRLAMFVPLDQRMRIVVPCRVVLRLQHQHRREQGFGVIQRIIGDRDLRQHAHRLGVVAVAQQEGADDLFGSRRLPIREQ